MTSGRLGPAVAIILSIVALGVALASLMDAVRNDGDGPGRVINTGVPVSLATDAVLFAADDFFLVRDESDDVHALYVYPPGYFGHVRGCRVVWDGRATIDTPDGLAGPGLFLDPCGGARFGRDGALLAGPADRDLDYFRVSPGVGGVVVDTKTLYCGAASATDGDESTPESEPAECDRVRPDD